MGARSGGRGPRREVMAVGELARPGPGKTGADWRGRLAWQDEAGQLDSGWTGWRGRGQGRWGWRCAGAGRLVLGSELETVVIAELDKASRPLSEARYVVCRRDDGRRGCRGRGLCEYEYEGS